MRLTELDEPGLFLLGIELLDSAGQTLFQTLERQLKPLYGEDWFSLSLVRRPEDRELAPHDLSVLLVQIEIRNNQNFRLALRAEYNEGKPHEKAYFENLTELRIMRNEWFHRIINPITTDELSDLCATILSIFPSNTELATKAAKIRELLNQEVLSTSDLLRVSKFIGGYVARLDEIEQERRIEQEIDELMVQELINEQNAFLDELIVDEMEKELLHLAYSPKVGEPYTGSLLPQKYTLKLDGTILDRRDGNELKDKLGERAFSIGQTLLRNHPTGGRLRLSSGGVVVGYVDEEWVVIGNLDLADWFDI